MLNPETRETRDSTLNSYFLASAGARQARRVRRRERRKIGN
jgi:hypothetical protein